MSSSVKFSRQREAIKEMIKNRKDHPTAEQLYADLKREYPHISLGTVYRNLGMLADIGEISKISGDGESVRYDGIMEQHSHFICKNCGKLIDLEIELDTDIYADVEEESGGKVDTHSLMFYGLCNKCKS